MVVLWLVLSSFTVLWAEAVNAQNSLFVSAYNQVAHGRLCGEVGENDLKAAGIDCDIKNSPQHFHSTSSAILEWSVFQQGAENQIEKNNCIEEKIEWLLNSKNQQDFDAWISIAAVAWAGMKRSQLFLKMCTHPSLLNMKPVSKQQLSNKLAFEDRFKNKVPGTVGRRSKPKDQAQELTQLLEFCSDETQISILKSADTLFPYMVPIVSDPEFFKIIEKHRKFLVDPKSGKPMTDSDLMRANLSDPNSFEVLLEEPLEQELRKSMEKLAQDRAAITKDLKNSKSKSGYDLSSAQKGFIFKDETIYSTMMSQGLLPESFKGGLGSPSEVSAGAFCILARYEPNAGAELAQMAVETALYGGALFKVFKAANILANGRAQKALLYGLGVQGMTEVANAISKVCPAPVVGDLAHRAKKTNSRSRTGDIPPDALVAAEMPKAMGFKIWKFDLDDQQTPSCKKQEDKNHIVKSPEGTSCLMEALLSVAPIATLPPLLLMENMFGL